MDLRCGVDTRFGVRDTRVDHLQDANDGDVGVIDDDQGPFVGVVIRDFDALGDECRDAVGIRPVFGEVLCADEGERSRTPGLDGCEG